MIDLWPNDIAVSTQRSPVAILREQASLLGQKTNNLVLAEVVEVSRKEGVTDVFLYDFFIVAPALSNYHYLLFQITHEIDLYPVSIIAESSIVDEVHGELDVPIDEKGKHNLEAVTEKEFLYILKKIFASQKTRRVITALLSQVDRNWSPSPDPDF